mmetsp:Transcript_13317/g.31981  ORF Transcript_13317/g.31981 Transcript_13317/m.31981 type:complete len:243 (-) Transcript_13317:116-844(-)
MPHHLLPHAQAGLLPALLGPGVQHHRGAPGRAVPHPRHPGGGVVRGHREVEGGPVLLLPHHRDHPPRHAVEVRRSVPRHRRCGDAGAVQPDERGGHGAGGRARGGQGAERGGASVSEGLQVHPRGHGGVQHHVPHRLVGLERPAAGHACGVPLPPGRGPADPAHHRLLPHSLGQGAQVLHGRGPDRPARRVGAHEARDIPVPLLEQNHREADPHPGLPDVQGAQQLLPLLRRDRPRRVIGNS